MPNTGRVVDRVLNRIAKSEYRLTVHYPAVKDGPTGQGPITQPVSPLIRFSAPPVGTPVQEPDTVQPAVSMKCLFLDALSLGQFQQERVIVGAGPWSRETTGLARVSGSDCELDGGRTVFDGSAYVTVGDDRYKVLGVRKVSASGSRQGTYYVYLTGAAKST